MSYSTIAPASVQCRPFSGFLPSPGNTALQSPDRHPQQHVHREDQQHEEDPGHDSGAGPERSALIVGWFHDEDNTKVLSDLLSLIKVRQQQQQRSGNQCEGFTFVITGDVHHFKNRNELKAYIEARGGKVAGSVSGSTSFLINNDVTSTSGKNKKAKELGIPILSEDDFLSRFSADDQVEEARPTTSATQLSLDF